MLHLISDDNSDSHDHGRVSRRFVPVARRKPRYRGLKSNKVKNASRCSGAQD